MPASTKLELEGIQLHIMCDITPSGVGESFPNTIMDTYCKASTSAFDSWIRLYV
eukprot:m.72061 g.72061  ORF g.72061 m.72061 type:complete len:54 (-) comp12300_c0_seq4:693-854(-)